VKIPRDTGGEALASLLGKYGYTVTRQTGSHMRLTSTSKGSEHHITIPSHNPLRIGTLGSIIGEVADYLEMEHQQLVEDLFR
jgi:predicted RNA binding protein YcfA (HicA-like mRNA interferase family)